jgi:hypothetical protein
MSNTPPKKSHPPRVTEPPVNRVRVSIHAASALSGLDLHVEAPTAEEAERLLETVWEKVHPHVGNPKAAGEPGRGPLAALLRKQIQERLSELGWTQSELGRRCEIESSQISMVLSGKAGLSPSRRRRLLEVLDLKNLEHG